MGWDSERVVCMRFRVRYLLLTFPPPLTNQLLTFAYEKHINKLFYKVLFLRCSQQKSDENSIQPNARSMEKQQLRDSLIDIGSIEILSNETIM
jgi:hypothetical protein